MITFSGNGHLLTDSPTARWRCHAASPEQVLWLSYEELKADPLASVRRIALHLGCDEAARDEQMLQRVVDLSSFGPGHLGVVAHP